MEYVKFTNWGKSKSVAILHQDDQKLYGSSELSKCIILSQIYDLLSYVYNLVHVFHIYNIVFCLYDLVSCISDLYLVHLT